MAYTIYNSSDRLPIHQFMLLENFSKFRKASFLRFHMRLKSEKNNHKMDFPIFTAFQISNVNVPLFSPLVIKNNKSF